MSSIEATGKTIDDALQAGLAQLGAAKEDVTVEVLEEPSRGFLGIGSKPAKLRLTLIEKEQAPVEEPSEEAVEEATVAPAEEELPHCWVRRRPRLG